MNKRTAKLLKEYARATDKDEKQLKKWWTGLSWIERTKKRKELSAALEEEVEEETVVETVAEEVVAED